MTRTHVGPFVGPFTVKTVAGKVLWTGPDFSRAQQEALAYSRSLPRWGMAERECNVAVLDARGEAVAIENWYR